ncbi:MAG: hypothetical protein ABWX81_00955 [Pseudolabrys sp.]
MTTYRPRTLRFNHPTRLFKVWEEHEPIWHRAGKARSRCFPQGSSMDSVLGQNGGVREMLRVLGAKGRLALMVWRGIGESPGFAALAEILERNIGQAAAAIMRAPFGLSDAAN